MSKKILISIIIIILALALVAGVGLLYKGKQGETETTEQSSVTNKEANYGPTTQPAESFVNQQPELSRNWKSYKNTTYKFKFQYSPEETLYIKGNTLFKWNAADMPDLSITVSLVDNSDGKSLSDFFTNRYTDNELAAWHYEGSLTSINNVEAYHETWIHQLQGENYYFKLPNKKILKFATTKPEEYSEGVPYIEKMLSTFKFIE